MMSPLVRLAALFIAVTAVAIVGLPSSEIFSQQFPEIYNSETDQQAQPVPAAEAAARFRLPDGLRTQVYACEPEVQNPIAMAWDSRGRLWVAENFTYAERSQRFDLSLRDRLLIFEDRDQDGVADRRIVFSDQLQMLTSVEVGSDGVWLMCPPQLLFLPDANHDDEPDGQAIAVLDGFEVATDNYHNFANGLKFGPDGWLYGRCGGSCPGRIGTPETADEDRVTLSGGIWRYHPRRQVFEVVSHGTTNPWGHDWNEWGDGFFINTVNGHLWQIIPGAHYPRPFTLDPNPDVYQTIEMHADHWHFDTRGDWTQSRDGAALEFGGGHAHCGMMIYLADHWPEKYRGRLMTLNLHGQRINQELLSRTGSGYVGRHGDDLFVSSDPFFRGIDLGYGPDGAVFVLDWSDTGECHESTGVHRTSGRIYRIGNPEKRLESNAVDLRSLTNDELIELHLSKNQWYVRQARKLLTQRCYDGPQDCAAAVEKLRALVESSSILTACQALWTLHAMDCVDQALLEYGLAHSDERVRVIAILSLTDAWPLDSVDGPTSFSRQYENEVRRQCEIWMPKLLRLAEHDDSGRVRLALASTLQRLPVDQRVALARLLMLREEDANDHNLPLLVWYGLIPVAAADPDALAEMAVECRWPLTQRMIVRRLAEALEAHPQTINRVLTDAEHSETSVLLNVLSGISVGLQGWRQAAMPAAWPQIVAAAGRTDSVPLNDLVRELSVLFGDGRALADVRELILNPATEIGVRRSALAALVASSESDVAEICLPLLSDSRLNVAALPGVARATDPQIAHALIENYRKFRAPDRPRVIAVLLARPSFASLLLDAMERQKIPAAHLTAFDVRQIQSLGDPELQRRVTELWGEVRDTPQDRRETIQSLKAMLTAADETSASPQQGRVLFNQHCRQCHRMFGQGEAIGPDLTGANRSNLDYLLENIVDPSAVVSKDFGMTMVMLEDGRLLTGLLAGETEKTLRLQTQTELLTIPRDEIEGTKRTTLSPMPDGLLDRLSPVQIRDLIAYLQQPMQVELPVQ